MLVYNPQFHQCIVQHTRTGPQHYDDQSAIDYPGYKMRKVGNGLYDAFKRHTLYFIEQNSKKDRRRKRNNQFKEVNSERIPQGSVNVVIQEQFLEIFQTYPGRFKKSQHQIIFLKSYDHSVHGKITENK
jgi:predicted SPOUT superfamily RNA methylase MTH1